MCAMNMFTMTFNIMCMSILKDRTKSKCPPRRKWLKASIVVNPLLWILIPYRSAGLRSDYTTFNPFPCRCAWEEADDGSGA